MVPQFHFHAVQDTFLKIRFFSDLILHNAILTKPVFFEHISLHKIEITNFSPEKR